MDENTSGIVDFLAELEDKVPDDVKQSLVYSDGYVVRGYKPDAAVGASCKTQYYEEYGSHTDALIHRSLSIPPASVCQWVIFCFIVFEVVKHVLCSPILRKLFMETSEFYAFCVPNKSIQKLTNILLKNFCIRETSLSREEGNPKIHN